MSRGLLSLNKVHPLQVHWQGTFIAEDAGEHNKIQQLDNTDLEAFGHRNQIRITNKCVLLRCSSWCNAVEIDVFLPPQVMCVIVRKYGLADSYCFFTNSGQKARPGRKLKWDPFKP